MEVKEEVIEVGLEELLIEDRHRDPPLSPNSGYCIGFEK